LRVSLALSLSARRGCVRILLAFAAATLPSHALGRDQLRVVATSADLKSLVEAVGRQRVEVESLASAEQDPHTFEAKPAQLARVRTAALVVRIGLDHEPWFARLKLPRDLPVLDASKNVRLIQTHTPRLRAERRAHVHAFGNTHYWLDPANARAITADIRDALAKLSPPDAQTFDANRGGFIDYNPRNLAHLIHALHHITLNDARRRSDPLDLRPDFSPRTFDTVLGTWLVRTINCDGVG